MDRVRTIFLNRAEPESIGLSSIGGMVRPVGPTDPLGLCLELGGNGLTVTAPVAPGMIREVCISTQRIMQIGEEFEIRLMPSVLALDGEREVEVHAGQQAVIRLGKAGPTVLDVTRVMQAAMQRKIFGSEMSAHLNTR